MRILAKDHAMAESSKGLNRMPASSHSRDADSITKHRLNSSVLHVCAAFAKNRGANSVAQATTFSPVEDVARWRICADATVCHAVIAASGGVQENPSSELGMTKPTTPSIRLPRARDMVAHQTVFARVLYCGHSFCKSYD
mmetsp:Transcript_111516/g.354902  ORF Transcript_111516/g.354902 Transcript_111516/m.354902 type:complete len:140 (-) Transcript_111516:39-458(-)